MLDAATRNGDEKMDLHERRHAGTKSRRTGADTGEKGGEWSVLTVHGQDTPTTGGG